MQKVVAPISVDQASRALGIAQTSVRKRIERGQMRGYKKNGRWYVHLDGTEDIPEDIPREVSDTTDSDRIKALAARLRFLEHEVEVLKDSNRLLALWLTTAPFFIQAEMPRAPRVVHRSDYAEHLRREPCAYCGAVEQRMTLDHITPLSRGGADSVENLAPACGDCNRRKRDKSLLKFFGEVCAEQAQRGA